MTRGSMATGRAAVLLAAAFPRLAAPAFAEDAAGTAGPASACEITVALECGLRPEDGRMAFEPGLALRLEKGVRAWLIPAAISAELGLPARIAEDEGRLRGRLRDFSLVLGFSSLVGGTMLSAQAGAALPLGAASGASGTEAFWGLGLGLGLEAARIEDPALLAARVEAVLRPLGAPALELGCGLSLVEALNASLSLGASARLVARLGSREGSGYSGRIGAEARWEGERASVKAGASRGLGGGEAGIVLELGMELRLVETR